MKNTIVVSEERFDSILAGQNSYIYPGDLDAYVYQRAVVIANISRRVLEGKIKMIVKCNVGDIFEQFYINAGYDTINHLIIQLQKMSTELITEQTVCTVIVFRIIK